MFIEKWYQVQDSRYYFLIKGVFVIFLLATVLGLGIFINKNKMEVNGYRFVVDFHFSVEKNGASESLVPTSSVSFPDDPNFVRVIILTQTPPPFQTPPPCDFSPVLTPTPDPNGSIFVSDVYRRLVEAQRITIEGVREIHSQKIFIGGWIPENLKKLLVENDFVTVSSLKESDFYLTCEGSQKFNKSDFYVENINLGPMVEINTTIGNKNVVSGYFSPIGDPEPGGSLRGGIFLIKECINKNKK